MMKIAMFYARLLLGTALLLASSLGDVALSVVGKRNSSTTACKHDAVRAEWVVNEWREGVELIWIEVYDLGRSIPVSRFDLFQISPSELEPSLSLETLDSDSETLQRLHSVVQSREYGPFVTPEVRTVRRRLL